MEFRWECRGHEKLVATSKTEVVLLHMNRALRKLGHLLVPALRVATPLGATHKLRNVTRSEILETGDGYRLEIRQGARSRRGYFYGAAVRGGTRPHFPPYRELIPWVEAVLGVHGKRAPSVAFLVARKISKRGTQANPYHERVLVENQAGIQGIVDDEGINLVGRLSGKTGG